MRKVFRGGLSVSLALALSLLSIVTVLPTVYAVGAEGDSIEVYGYGGGGGGGGGNGAINSATIRTGGVGGSGATSAFNGFSGGNGETGNGWLRGGGGGGGGGQESAGESGYNNGTGGAAGTGGNATSGIDRDGTSGGAGGNGSIGKDSTDSRAETSLGTISVIAGNGGNGGQGGFGSSSSYKGGNGGTGGNGGGAALTLSASSITAGAITVQSGEKGNEGATGVLPRDGEGGTGGAGGSANLTVGGTLTTTSIEVVKNDGGVSVNVNTLDVTSNTTITVNGTSEVTFGTVKVANGATLTINCVNNGQMTIGYLLVEQGGTVTMPNNGSVIVEENPTVELDVPSGNIVELTETNLVLSFSQAVAALSGNITITVDGSVYSCDVGSAIISGFGADTIATIPLASFENNGVLLELAINKTYSVNVTGDTFRIAGTFTNGNVIGNLSFSDAFTTRGKEATPNATIGYIEETLTGLVANANYNINGIDYSADANGKIALDSIPDDAWLGTNLAITKKGSTAATDSEEQLLSIPARPQSPVVYPIEPSTPSGTGGISGTTTGMAYGTDNSSSKTSWTDCSDTNTTGLAAETTYYVFLKAVEGSSFASLAVEVTVGRYIPVDQDPPLEILEGGLAVGEQIEKTYGDADFTLTTEGGSGTGAITWSSSNEDIATVNNGGKVTIISVGETVITASKAGDDAYHAASAQTTLVVRQKPVTIEGLTAEDKTYDGTTAAIVLGSATIDIVPGDDVVINIGTAEFEDVNADQNKNVTFSRFSLTGDDAGNYELSDQPEGRTADISPTKLTVTPTADQWKYFGESDPVLTYDYTAGISEDEVPAFTGELTRDEGEDPGSYDITLGTLKLIDNNAFLATNYSLELTLETVEIVDYELTLSGLPDKIYVGDKFILTPESPTPDDQTGSTGWIWDENYFSATFNSPATFIALQEGETTITYVDSNGIGASVEVEVLVAPVDPLSPASSGVPDPLATSSSTNTGTAATGDNSSGGLWLALIVTSAIGACTAAGYRRKKMKA